MPPSGVPSTCESIGLENVRLIETPGNPIVYGEWLDAPGAPTILFYGHYDVQPVDPVELWESPPFEATVREGEIYARGAADDKGQVFMHFKAIEAHMKQTGRLPLNIKVFLEGEEEVGSLHLDEFVRQNKPLLAADVVVISDSAMFARGDSIDLLRPARAGVLPDRPARHEERSSLRRVRRRDGESRVRACADSGADEGQERAGEDRRLLRRCEGADAGRAGRVEEAAVRREEVPQGLGCAEARRRIGYSVLERVWGRPTFEVNGLLSGFTGEGPKTVIPAVAMAKVSMRLVPNQDPDKIAKLFEEYVEKIAPATVELKLTRLHGGKPWMAEFDSPYIRAAGRAIEKGFGKTPVFTREGGSIPVVATFQEELGIPSVLFGVGLPDENAHAPNEKLDLGNFHGGVIASAHLYRRSPSFAPSMAKVVRVTADAGPPRTVLRPAAAAARGSVRALRVGGARRPDHADDAAMRR